MAAINRKADRNHLQLRLTGELRAEIGEIAGRLDVTSSDVIRGALHFGLPVFAAMSGIREEMVRRLVQTLKEGSREIRKTARRSKRSSR